MIAQFKLVSVEGHQAFELTKEEMLIGREQGCDILIEEGNPSRRHAKIICTDTNITIEDLQSTNGTFVNNNRVNRPCSLKEGDVVRFDTAAFFLVNINREDITLMNRNLYPQRQDGSYVLSGDDDENSEQTVFRQIYPMPPGQDKSGGDSAFAQDKASQYSSEVVERIISEGQEKNEGLDAALVVVSGEHQSDFIGLALKQPQQRWRIGRLESCDIHFSDQSVSSLHANLYCDGDEWLIRDNDSDNGVLVNQQSITSRSLNDGDMISLGRVDMVFKILS